MVYAVNEGIVYMSATAPSKKHQADMVLTVGKDAQGGCLTAVLHQSCSIHHISSVLHCIGYAAPRGSATQHLPSPAMKTGLDWE